MPIPTTQDMQNAPWRAVRCDDGRYRQADAYLYRIALQADNDNNESIAKLAEWMEEVA